MSDKPRVMIAIPNLGWIAATLARRYPGWMTSNRIIFDPVGVRPFALARNVCVEAAQGIQATHIYFNDSDVTPPEDVVERLLEPDCDVVSGVYNVIQTIGNHQIEAPAMWIEPEPGRLRCMIESNGTHRIDYCGCGCLLIKMSVFDHLPARPFNEGFVDDVYMPEDTQFCRSLHEANIPIFAQCDVKCIHRKEKDLDANQNPRREQFDEGSKTAS